tara:strand:- start:243 stop:1217 length:975 start_codon:yes stop_codon:yes gene_type:complete
MKNIIKYTVSLFCLITFIVNANAEISFKTNVPGNKESIAYKSAQKFADEARKASNGEINIKVFDSSALGDQVSSIQSMIAGTLDMATVETPITTIDSALGATALPYIFISRDHIEKALSGKAGDWIQKRLNAKGLVVLAYLEGGFRHITNNKRPIVTPADLKGVKMRTPGSKLRILTFNTYGANASPLPFKELYTALSTKTFDGQENPIIWVKSQKFYEVQQYLSLTGHVYTVTYLLMSKTKYDKLSSKDKEILQKAGQLAKDYSIKLGIEADSKVADFLKSKGMKVNQANAKSFVDASRPVWDEWVSKEKDGKELIKLIEDSK